MLTSNLTLIGLAALLILTKEVGYRCNRWSRQRREMTSEEGSSFVMSSALTLLALLIGFTFGMAQSNFELRRDLVTHEANAISTAHLRHQLLNPGHSRELNSLMAEYIRVRMGFSRTGGDPKAVEAVGVAVLPDQSSVLAVSATGVDHQYGARQEAAIVIDRRQLLDPQALAPRDAGHACEGDLDEPDFGVSGQEGPAFLRISDRIGGHGRNLGSDVTSTFATPCGTRQPGRALTPEASARTQSSWRPVPWAPGRW